MPRAKKTTENTTFSNVKAKRLRKKKPINTDMMVEIKPLTPSQEKVFEYWNNNKNLFMYGAAQIIRSSIILPWLLRNCVYLICPGAILEKEIGSIFSIAS